MKNKYLPQNIEKYIKKIWNNFIIKKSINTHNKYYSILPPPPNITGNIHIGHILQYSIIDFYIRYNKMLKKNTLLNLGLDHAGIATQILIEKNNKNISNYNNFINITLKWKKKIEKKLLLDIKNIGILIDNNNKIRFTLDNHYKYLVNKIFSLLYYDNLIYKSNKIVNWDLKLKTAISDLEIINKKELSNIWYIKYYFINKNLDNKFIIISTTKPETIFADSAIAVNKNDIRYSKYIGEKVIIPIINRIITIIHSDDVIINNESGCIKVSPSSSFVDYEIALKNNLKIINIFDENFIIKDFFEIYNVNNILLYKEECPDRFKKMHFNDIKKNILLILKENKYIIFKKKKYINIKYNSRNMSRVEPFITSQWYIKMKNISNIAINLVKNKKISFFPKKYELLYFNWINNIKDWCISRQIWWGHKIPIWYDDNNNIYSGINENYIRKKFNIKKNISLTQDNSVLDTWFSSSIWSFASLKWPNNINKFIKFYPYDLVISGFDIIFFWISRMIIISSYVFKNNNKINFPFKNIYITGLIKDKNGNKISKSNNNIIDYLNILNINNKYLGIDSLRMSLLSLNNSNKYINFNNEKIITYNKFCNKLWNISIYIINKINYKFSYNSYINIFNKIKKIKINISIYDKWIISKLNNLIKKYVFLSSKYRLDLIVKNIYNFIYYDLSSCYIELTKNVIIKNKHKIINNYILLYLLESIIKILHPILPFITEKIKINILKKFNIKINNILINCKFPSIIFNINNDYNNIINVILYIIKDIRSFNNKINFNIIIKYKKIYFNIIKINLNNIINKNIKINFILNNNIIKDFIIY